MYTLARDFGSHAGAREGDWLWKPIGPFHRGYQWRGQGFAARAQPKGLAWVPRLDLNDLMDTPAAPAKAVSSGNDLLDLLDGGPAAPAVAPAMGDGLLDILGMPPAAAQEAAPMVAFEKNGLKITFYPRKAARQPLASRM